MVLEPLTAVWPETVAVATEHVRTVPPIIQDTTHAHAQGEPLTAHRTRRAGEDVARGDVFGVADEDRVGLCLLSGGDG